MHASLAGSPPLILVHNNKIDHGSGVGGHVPRLPRSSVRKFVAEHGGTETEGVHPLNHVMLVGSLRAILAITLEPGVGIDAHEHTSVGPTHTAQVTHKLLPPASAVLLSVPCVRGVSTDAQPRALAIGDANHETRGGGMNLSLIHI
eukprot:8236457-Alexandrium_andersonii.AAC.1